MKRFRYKQIWDSARTSKFLEMWAIVPFWVHCFHRGDCDPDPHDHEFDFVTFPLVSYVEHVLVETQTGEWVERYRLVKAWRFHRRKAEYRHRILGKWNGRVYGNGNPGVVHGKVWTILWKSKPRRKSWGFHVLQPDGSRRFVHHTRYPEAKLA